MKRYLKFYLYLIKLNYHKAIYYRADTISGFFGSFVWAIFSIIAIFILTARSSSVFGWTREELFVLIGGFNIIVGGIFRMLCSRNFENFARVVQHGDLDGILLKPIDSQFIISFQEVRLHGLIRTSMAVIYTYIALIYANIELTFLGVLTFLVLTVFGLIILYSMWFIVMTFIIWFPDLYNLHEILYTTDSLTRYPPPILPAMGMLVFYIFFPFTIAVSTPIKALIHKLTIPDVFWIVVVSFGLLYISRKFWKFALKYYTSASG